MRRNSKRPSTAATDLICEKDLEQVPLQQKDLTAIVDFMSERLSCFTIIGYDYAGTPISFSFVKNHMQDTAISSLVAALADRIDRTRMDAIGGTDEHPTPA